MAAVDDTGGTVRFLSFVLPVHNEASTLRPLYEQIKEAMSARPCGYEMIFIDDGSTDDSFARLAGIQAQDARVRVVRFRRNFGKAAAYSAGFSRARGDVILTLDTDLQDDPSEISLFLDKLDEGFDMVVGWRYGRQDSPNKTLPSRFFNFVVRRITGIPLHDFNCPFKAYRQDVLRELRVYGELHRYIPVMAAARGFSLAEIRITNHPRRFGSSNYGMERYLRGMLDLLTVLFITRFAKRPMHLLALGGLLAAGLGAAIVALLVTAHLLYVGGVLQDVSWRIHDRPALSLGILLLIVGIQFISSGLLAELFVIDSAWVGRDSGYSVAVELGGEPESGD